MSENIEILIEAQDEASAVIESAAESIDGSLQQINASTTELSDSFSNAQTQMQDSMEQTRNETTNLTNAMADAQAQQKDINASYGYGASALDGSTNSLRDNVMSMNSLALSGANLYMSVTRVENAQVALDRANLNVQKSQDSLAGSQITAEKAANTVTAAQEAYNTAVLKYGENSQQAKDALNKLTADQQAYTLDTQKAQVAQDAYTVAQERAGVAQRNFDDAILMSSLQAIPSLLTIGDKAITMYQNWAGAADEAAAASASVGAEQLGPAGGAAGLGGAGVGVGGASLAGAAVAGGAALAAGAGLGALGVEALKAAGVKPGMFEAFPRINPRFANTPEENQELSLGWSAADILAGKANPYTAPHLAEGGIVTEETLAVIGEEGPEVVIPLTNPSAASSLENIAGSSGRLAAENLDVYPHLANGGIATEETPAILGEAGPEAIIPLENILSSTSFASQNTTINTDNSVSEGDQNVTINMTTNPSISIGQLSGGASMQDIVNAVVDAVNRGMAQPLVDALNRAFAEKQRRRS